MKLTSKRILNGLAVCVGAFALTASAVTTWVSDSFEAPEGAANKAIKLYKAAAYGEQLLTNYLWVADADDASMLVASNRTYAGNSPIPDADENIVLQLDTENKMLTRYVDIHTNETATALVTNSLPFNESAVYVDTLIKFVASEDDPPITDTGIKIAVFVNNSSNLVVYHRVYTNATSSTTTNSVIAAPVINPANWYRLTIKMGMNAELGAAACQVYLDGTLLTHANGYNDAGEDGGSWFMMAHTDLNNKSLSQISFQGTGFLDEFVVADAVSFAGSTAYMLTLAFDDTKIRVLNMGNAGAPVAKNGTVATGTSIAIEATNGWYEIASVTGADTGSFTGSPGSPVPGDPLVTATTGTVSATANDTLTVTAQKFSGGTISTGLGGGSLPANKVADWAMGLSTPLSPDQLNETMLNDYLLDVEPGTAATISITSIEVAGGTATVTLEASATVDFQAINGELVILGTDNLADAFTAVATNPFQFSQAGDVVTIAVPTSKKFLKAKIQVAQ